MRKPLIAGNWKMYKNNVEAMELVRELAPLIAGLAGVEVAVPQPGGRAVPGGPGPARWWRS